MQAINPTTWHVEARVSGVQGYPWLLRKFKLSLGVCKLLFQKQKTKQTLVVAA